MESLLILSLVPRSFAEIAGVDCIVLRNQTLLQASLPLLPQVRVVSNATVRRYRLHMSAVS